VLREALQHELASRRSHNARYSLRAFARHAGVHHGTLSRILAGRARPSAAAALAIAARLGLDRQAVEASCARDHDDAVVRAVARPASVASSRWVAIHTGLGVDVVNASLFRLLSAGRLSMHGARWEVHGSSGRQMADPRG
jgi:transcriptional regulator with XRE-family HTH domain